MARNPIRPPGDDLAVRFSEIERRLRALESATPGGFSGDGETTFLRDGRDLRVVGGNIEVLDNGDIIIDGGQLVAGPTTVDASGVVIGPTTLDASGLTVGTDVEIDSAGLHVAGGLVQGVWVFATSEQTQDNVTVDNSAITSQLIQDITVDPPDWVQQLFVVAVASYQASGDVVQNIITRATVDDGGASQHNETHETHKHESGVGQTASVMVQNFRTIPLSPAGRAVDVSQYARVSTGTNTSNRLRLSVTAYGVRSAFT